MGRLKSDARPRPASECSKSLKEESLTLQKTGEDKSSQSQLMKNQSLKVMSTEEVTDHTKVEKDVDIEEKRAEEVTFK